MLHKCVTCKKIQGKPYLAPVNPPLPKCRLQESPPFTVTGVDFSGELYVKSNNKATKAYVCLFTCAVTRAIHLELVEDMTSQTFIYAFRRLAVRRSLPAIMIQYCHNKKLTSTTPLTLWVNNSTNAQLNLPSYKICFGRDGNKSICLHYRNIAKPPAE